MTGAAILLVGADTARARSYAGALSAHGLGPVFGVFYGAPQPQTRVAVTPAGWPDHLAVPTIGRSISSIFDENDWPLRLIEDADTINAPSVVAAIADCAADLGVFCGRGGEIVSSPVLDAGPPLLHCHPGRLPSERGSTTIYYSLLDRRPCTVSALLLAAELDAGPLVGMREYPSPRAGCDVDVLYDCAIRADMLRRVVADYRATGVLPRLRSEGEGTLYFVVHPVLKHLALLSLPGAGHQEPKERP